MSEAIHLNKKMLAREIARLGSDNHEHFGGDFTGGYCIQQDPTELAELTATLYDYKLNPKTYLGIGIAAGGTERFLCERLQVKDLAVIDLGVHPKAAVWTFENKPALLAQGVMVREFIGDSHSGAATTFLLEQGTVYDIVGIDGDHSPMGVRLDWMLVQPFVKPGTLVWFHDTWVSGAGQTGALELWRALKRVHNVRLDACTRFGIGVIEI